jgi:DNA-binding IclR family transcriptional regulator
MGKKRAFRKGPTWRDCRTAQETRKLYDLVRNTARGITINAIVHQLKWSRGKVEGKLVGLERMGLLVMEDETGRLYPFSSDFIP